MRWARLANSPGNLQTEARPSLLRRRSGVRRKGHAVKLHRFQTILRGFYTFCDVLRRVFGKFYRINVSAKPLIGYPRQSEYLTTKLFLKFAD
jgi:hypothetical protein